MRKELIAGAITAMLVMPLAISMHHPKPTPTQTVESIPLTTPKVTIKHTPKNPSTKEPTWCVQVKEAVSKYGKDTVEQGAVARSMTKAQIQQVYKRCHING